MDVATSPSPSFETRNLLPIRARCGAEMLPCCFCCAINMRCFATRESFVANGDAPEETEISIVPAQDTAFAVAQIFLVPGQKLSVLRLIHRLPAQNTTKYKVQINGSTRAV
jgi:hypothetical protein